MKLARKLTFIYLFIFLVVVVEGVGVDSWVLNLTFYMTPDGLRAAVRVSVAIFQPCYIPGTKCAGKYNLLKYFADVQAVSLVREKNLPF